MKTIAIIDDDIYIGNMLKELLEGQSYLVLRAYSGTEALLLLKDKRPDLILLDLMLPGLPGEEVLSQIKGIPVIVVSAKADTCDKVNLLLGGAVDYITKPFSTEELLARIQVQLRKASPAAGDEVLYFDDLCLDERSHLVSAGETPIHLTKTEFAILKQLIKSEGQVITKSHMLDIISLDTPDCTESSLKVHVSNLRGKLRAVNGKDYIEGVWGIGFKMRAQ